MAEHNKLVLDGTKIAWHQERLEQWRRGERFAPITIDMALTILQQKKIQRLLVLLLIAALCITAAVLWFGFLAQQPVAGFRAHIKSRDADGAGKENLSPLAFN